MFLSLCFRRMCFTSVVRCRHDYIKALSSSANLKLNFSTKTAYNLNNEPNGFTARYYASDNTLNKNLACWKCGKSAEKALFCPECQSLQKPSKDVNYFQVLGLEETFKIDETQLSKIYKDLQKSLHPDKYSNKESTEQSISAEYSSLVNKAYSTLQQPLSRGLYMLRLRGIELSDKTEMASEFLQEIMQRNEQVEEAETEEEVMELFREIREVLGGQEKELGEALEGGDLEKAREVVIQMKYYTSVETQLKETIRRMGIVT